MLNHCLHKTLLTGISAEAMSNTPTPPHDNWHNSGIKQAIRELPLSFLIFRNCQFVLLSSGIEQILLLHEHYALIYFFETPIG